MPACQKFPFVKEFQLFYKIKRLFRPDSPKGRQQAITFRSIADYSKQRYSCQAKSNSDLYKVIPRMARRIYDKVIPRTARRVRASRYLTFA